MINNKEQETASYACKLLRLASVAGKNSAPSNINFARKTVSPILRALVEVVQGNNGYNAIAEFLAQLAQ